MSYNPTDRRERVLRYFIKTPNLPNANWFYIRIGICFVLFIIGYVMGGVAAFFFGLGGLIEIWVFGKGFFESRKKYYEELKNAYSEVGLKIDPYSWNKLKISDELISGEPKATDQEMKQWFYDAIQMCCKKSIDRLDIIESEVMSYDDKDYETPNTGKEPPKHKMLLLWGPISNSLTTVGNDGVLRFNLLKISIIFLTKHHIAVYQCEDFDLSTGRQTMETTKEFPFKDITNLETKTVNLGIIKNGQKGELAAKQVELFTSGGNSFSTFYTFEENSKNVESEPIPISITPNKKMKLSLSGENTVKALRTRLKEYKNDFMRKES